jgi:DNA-directed RNA polymerase subunit M/transcription elongation factor TFIIS
MKFCQICGNMYYTRLLNEQEDKLIYYCRKCGNEDDNFSADSKNLCVSKTHISGGKVYSHIINEYTHLDPTLPRIKNIKCPNDSCKSNEEIQGETKEKDEHEIIYLRYDDVSMKFIYLCNTCNHIWKN